MVVLKMQEQIILTFDEIFAIGEVVKTFEHAKIICSGGFHVSEILSACIELLPQHSICYLDFSLLLFELVDSENSLKCKNDSVFNQTKPKILFCLIL
jgi:hypothetical protein